MSEEAPQYGKKFWPCDHIKLNHSPKSLESEWIDNWKNNVDKFWTLCPYCGAERPPAKVKPKTLSQVLAETWFEENPAKKIMSLEDWQIDGFKKVIEKFIEAVEKVIDDYWGGHFVENGIILKQKLRSELL